MTSSRLTPHQIGQHETGWYAALARDILDHGCVNGLRLLSLTEHREGWLWWRKVTGYRAIVATDGVYARSGVQPAPLAAVKAALMKLYPTLT